MKQTGVVCQPGPVLIFSLFRFEYLITSPESYRGFRETGPWVPFLERPGNFSGPQSNIQIKTCGIVAKFLAHKPVNFASDNF